MSDRGTRPYVSSQELLAGQGTTGGSEKLHDDHRLRLPVKLKKADPVKKEAFSYARNESWRGVDAALPLQDGSPWKRYREILSVTDMGDKVIVACERDAPNKRVNIRRFPRDEKEAERISWFRNVRHTNIVSALQLFAGQKILYAVLEQMQLPIDHLVRCPRQPSADEVGVIMG